MKKFNVIMILVVFVVQCYGETGDANFKDIWARKKLTGDWCGLRSDLAEQGIIIDVRMTNYYQAVTSGGSGHSKLIRLLLSTEKPIPANVVGDIRAAVKKIMGQDTPVQIRIFQNAVIPQPQLSTNNSIQSVNPIR